MSNSPFEFTFEQALQLAELCGRWPLAIRVVGGYISHKRARASRSWHWRRTGVRTACLRNSQTCGPKRWYERLPRAKEARCSGTSIRSTYRADNGRCI